MIDPSTRLRRAILLNDVLLAQRIIRNHPHLLQNPDFDDRANTSLHLAAAHGSLEMATALLDAGHERSGVSRNAEHETALMVAARAGHAGVGALLVAREPASIACINRAGRDALAEAAGQPASTALLPLLLQHAQFPASPHARDCDGNTPLHHASAAGALKALRILLAAGASPAAKNNYDWTPLAYSQTVAAEVYFKNLVAEVERRRAEGARQSEEREWARAAGVRLVDDDGVGVGGGGSGNMVVSPSRGPNDEDELIEDALKRHWSPVERKRPVTPGGGAGAARREWGAVLGHVRTRSGS